MLSAMRSAFLVLFSSTLLLLLLPSVTALSAPLLSLSDGPNSSDSSTGGTNTTSPFPSVYGCNVAAPEPPFVLVSNATLDHSAQSIAIFNHTLYYSEQYASFTGFVYTLDLRTQLPLPSVDITLGAAAFPKLAYPASAWQLRIDASGRFHLVDLRNGVFICMTLDSVWQSVVPGGVGGIWSFDISPDGETYFVNWLGSGSIQAIQRRTGASLPFQHQPTASSVAYGPDGAMWLANGNYGQPPSIDRISSNGKVLSSIDLSAFSALQLDISAVLVDSNGTIIFTNRQGSSCNDLAAYYPQTGKLSVWKAVAGYDFGLAYDAATNQITCLRGYDDGAVFTFAALEQSASATIYDAGSLPATEPTAVVPELRLARLRKAMGGA